MAIKDENFYNVDTTRLNMIQQLIGETLANNAIKRDYTAVAALGVSFIVNCNAINESPILVMLEIVQNIAEKNPTTKSFEVKKVM